MYFKARVGHTTIHGKSRLIRKTVRHPALRGASLVEALAKAEYFLFVCPNKPMLCVRLSLFWICVSMNPPGSWRKKIIFLTVKISLLSPALHLCQPVYLLLL